MQKDTLFDSRLCVREFGSHLLNVANLLEWAKSKGHYFPPTEPPIENYQFAQVEALLVAIERVFQALDEAQALNIVRSQPEHHHHAAVTNNDGRMAKWLLHADAHAKWHSLVATAVNHHELRLLDYASHLPISAVALGALLESLPDINQSYSSDDAQASDTQAAAEPLQIQANKKKPQVRDKRQQQIDAIIAELVELGYNPSSLPEMGAGQRSAKAEVSDNLYGKDLFTAPTAFENAWQELARRYLIGYET